MVSLTHGSSAKRGDRAFVEELAMPSAGLSRLSWEQYLEHERHRRELRQSDVRCERRR